jgi:hypothetical protein
VTEADASRGPIFVVAGRRNGPPGSNGFDQRQVIWRSDNRLCVVWGDGRRGALEVWARCSTDRARTFGADVLLSDRGSGASYKSPSGFRAAVWSAAESDRQTGSVWVNSVDVSYAVRR